MTALFHDFYNKKADWIHELHSIKQPFILIIIDKLPILMISSMAFKYRFILATFIALRLISRTQTCKELLN